jgi:hypothetical protein
MYLGAGGIKFLSPGGEDRNRFEVSSFFSFHSARGHATGTRRASYGEISWGLEEIVAGEPVSRILSNGVAKT